jgi:mannose-6-phosphate isomerase-like protein (cupin superfamily)
MDYKSINFANKFNKFEEQWSPRVIAAMNDYRFKLAKIQGEFVWHSHQDSDEAFVVLYGEMEILLPEARIRLGPGEMFVVPKGIEHRPVAEKECGIMLIEPQGVINTGDAGGELTIEQETWI